MAGMGGVGKTELALQYARRYAMNRRDVTVERLFSRPWEKLTSNLTPQPPSLQGKGENSKPLSLQERGLERGFPDSVYPGGVCWLDGRGVDLGIQIVQFARAYLPLKNICANLCKIRRHAVLTTSRRILTDLSKLPEGIDSSR
ncbi:hypothetical protein [Coleofasciculus sp.]|uniref:hypothetical protein n=1 Tax=Coleofasciculus sp. TaxID=3100458 RepID=UPI003A32818C